MNFIRNFFSTIAGSLLTLTLGLLIIAFSISLVLFDSKFVLGTLEKNNTYKVVATEIVPKILIYALTQRFEEQAPDQGIANKLAQKLDKSTFENLSGDLKKIVENSYFFVIGEKEQFEVRLELKDYIPNLQQNLTSAVASLQAEGQLQDFNIAELNTNLQDASNASIHISQDKVEVTGLKELESKQNPEKNDKSFLRQARANAERIKQAQALLLVATVVLAVFLFVTRVPHFLSGFKWLANTLISSAIFPLVLGILLLLIKPVGIVTRFLNEQEDIANFQAAVALVSVNLEAITQKIFLNILVISACLIALAIVLHVLIFFLNKRNHKPS